MAVNTSLSNPESVGSPEGPLFSVPALRRYFDPSDAHRKLPDDAFLESVARTRTAVTIRGIGRVAGHEVTLLESLHAGLHMPAVATENARSLPVDPERQATLNQYARTYALRVSRATLEVVDDLGRTHPSGPDDEREAAPLFDRLQLAAGALAASAHNGVLRRSGRDYFLHPQRTAASVQIAYDGVDRALTVTEQENREVQKALAQMHDIFEETIDPSHYSRRKIKPSTGRYINESRTIFSPLVVGTLARELGLDFVECQRLAVGILALTRTRDAAGNKAPYKHYTEAGVLLAGADFYIPKTADVHDNSDLEPDPSGRPVIPLSKGNKKRRQYRTALKSFEVASRDDSVASQVVARAQTVTQEEIDAMVATWEPFDYHDAARRMKERLASRG